MKIISHKGKIYCQGKNVTIILASLEEGKVIINEKVIDFSHICRLLNMDRKNLLQGIKERKIIQKDLYV